MIEKKIGYDDAYSLKTPEDSIKLYKKWAQTYDQDFAFNSNYLSPNIICNYFNKHARSTDIPILDVGAGTGLVGECLFKTGNKKIIGIDISPEMLEQAKLKGCYSSLMEEDVTKKISLKPFFINTFELMDKTNNPPGFVTRKSSSKAFGPT